jgi:hypothetical protein
MRLPRPIIELAMTAITRSHYQAAIERTLIGISLGLIDVHSRSGDWFDATFAYLIAGFAGREDAGDWRDWRVTILEYCEWRADRRDSDGALDSGTGLLAGRKVASERR